MRDINTQLSPVEKSFTQKLNREILELTDIITKPDRYLQKIAHGTFFKIDHILAYKASLNRFKKTEITP